MLQDKVLLWPEAIFVGEDVKLVIVGGAGALTATVTVAVTLPAAQCFAVPGLILSNSKKTP